ncbi:uncharacterized, partial [Tachysurus ichikawai]
PTSISVQRDEAAVLEHFPRISVSCVCIPPRVGAVLTLVVMVTAIVLYNRKQKR